MLDWQSFYHWFGELGFTLNAREWAGLLWLSAFLLWALSRKDVRSGLASVPRALLVWKVLIPLLAFFAWAAFEVWIAASASLWEWSFTKDTVLWVLTAGIVSFVAHQEASAPNYFRHGVIGAVSAVMLIEYFVNLSVFPLWAELVIQPVLVLLVGISVVSERRKEYHNAKRATDFLLGVIGLVLLAYTAFDLYSNRHAIDWIELGLKALLPIWLTIGLLPYVYLFDLIANYETAFMRMDWKAKKEHAPWWAKLALASSLHLRNQDVRAAAKRGVYHVANAHSFSVARQAVKEFQRSLRKKERVAEEKKERLVRYAGSQEIDAEGRRLDRREFEETQAALRWLATCQMGWYRNQGRYPSDLIERFDDDFTRQGLPLESGISMHVSDDGQSWYAWRRTVTGWCFAIGASGPPPNQWTYDGPEPPDGFPGEDPAWSESPFSLDMSRNWD